MDNYNNNTAEKTNMYFQILVNCVCLPRVQPNLNIFIRFSINELPRI